LLLEHDMIVPDEYNPRYVGSGRLSNAGSVLHVNLTLRRAESSRDRDGFGGLQRDAVAPGGTASYARGVGGAARLAGGTYRWFGRAYVVIATQNADTELNREPTNLRLGS
jgi:hypothetical protein